MIEEIGIPGFTGFPRIRETYKASFDVVTRLKAPRTKNVKTYLTHFPIKSYHEADLLSKETTWRVMDCIRQAGAQGITADEITRRERLPHSAVYSTLKELYRLEYIFLYPREKKSKGERKKRFVCERSTWGKYRIDQEFDAALRVSGALEKVSGDLRQPVMKSLQEVYARFDANKELQKFIPTRHTNTCPNCQRSHEAMEFFYAIMLRSIDLMVTESEDFKKFLVDKSYGTDS